MITSNKKKITLGLFLLLIALSVPLTLSLMNRPQETRSRASGSTSLSFQPVSSISAPLQVNVGDTIPLDMIIDPGTNFVTFIRYQVTYDPTKIQISTTDPFTLNSSVFSTVEGPVATGGAIAQSVSIGSDPTKAVQKITKIGTLNLKAIGGTGGAPTTVTFGSLSQALSAGPNDQASQNVLSTTTPATIVIGGNAGTPSATITQPPLDGTILSFTMLLHGVGSAGDNPNPSGNTLSNKNPLHPQRNMQVQVFDTNNQVVASTTAAITFDTATGTFTGKAGVGKTFPSGNYNVKVKTDRYLRKLVSGIQQIKNLQDNPIPSTAVVAGDTNGDNFLNVLDYNAMLDCGYGHLSPLPNADPNADFNKSTCQVHTPAENVDLDDNGIISSVDYNLFLRELSVQNGD